MDMLWSLAVVAVLLCCCGGCAALIVPDAVAAFSPFNW
jgi:hypothetical protein